LAHGKKYTNTTTYCKLMITSELMITHLPTAGSSVTQQVAAQGVSYLSK